MQITKLIKICRKQKLNFRDRKRSTNLLKPNTKKESL